MNMVWSLTSGKRQITMDQKEVHYSVGRSGKFEFSWTMKGNHVLKVVAFASAPVNNPQFRQFDLSVDGQSFFHMPKIFEVGLAGPPQAHSRAPGDYSQYQYEQSPRDREEQDLQAAIAASLQESRSHLQKNNRALPSSGPAPAPATASKGADLLDMSAPAGAPPVPSVQAPPPAAFAPPAPAPFMSPASVATAPQPTAVHVPRRIFGCECPSASAAHCRIPSSPSRFDATRCPCPSTGCPRCSYADASTGATSCSSAPPTRWCSTERSSARLCRAAASAG